MHQLFFCALLVTFTCTSQAARILCIYPTPSISHQVVFRVLNEELLRRGHHLVVLTTDPIENGLPGYQNMTQIDVHSISYDIWGKFFNFVEIRDTKGSNSAMSPMYFEVMIQMMDLQLQTPEVKRLIDDKNEKFDLLIVETLVPTMFAFADRFKTPIVSISSFAATLQNYDAMGNPSHPLLYPDMFCPFVGQLSFFQRLYLVYQDLEFRWTYYQEFLPRFEAVAKKHFGENSMPVGELERKTDIMLLNVHPMVIGVRPVVPGIVYIGSLHILNKKPLPKDLKRYLDESTQGVVYFSLGTNVRSKDLPLKKRQELLQAFAELPYNVLWKWENDTMNDKPSNVFISKWLPQQDILGHPNIKVFMTQGGQQSMDEGMHNEVPMVGMPFLGDQDHNVGKIVKLGVGLRLDFQSLTKESVKRTIIEVITNKKFKDNARKLSNLLSDEPMTSLERAVWWTEYVIRHKGAEHLRAPMMDFPLYQYYFLDIVGLCVACLVAVLTIAYMFVKIIRQLLVSGFDRRASFDKKYD